MNCDFKNTRNESDCACSGSVVSLKTCSSDDIVTVLTENCMLPVNYLETTLNICSSHFNFYLKSNTDRKRALVCCVPSFISGHPCHVNIDGTINHVDNPNAERFVKKRKANVNLKLDVIVKVNQRYGITIPVGTGKRKL